MAGIAFQQAHDQLLAALPPGMVHACDMCTPAANHELAKEEAEVADTRTFTEDEHILLMANAVQEQTAALQTEVAALKAEKGQLQAKLDVADAQAATLTAERASVQSAFDQFKEELASKETIAARRDERVTKMKASADHLPDSYFTGERADRWASMPDGEFETAVTDLASTKAAAGPDGTPSATETAAFTGGVTPSPGEGFAVTDFLAAASQPVG